MTNLGGHDVDYLIESFRVADAEGDQPTCFIAYTIKGMGLPFAGHKDNHSGMMTKEQMAVFSGRWASAMAMNGTPSRGWRCRGRTSGLDRASPSPSTIAPEGRRLVAPAVPVPASFPVPRCRLEGISPPRPVSGTSWRRSGEGRGPGRWRGNVTTSPDVTVSTNLGPWVNRRGIFDRHLKNDVFRDAKLASAQRWGMSPKGQHIELGIAEQNLFLLFSALGLSHSLYGARLLPVGTVYDPFVNRGLDALIYACYQDARFLWYRRLLA